MENYLEQMRQRPEHHKKYFALGVSGCFTAIIFLVWVFANFGGAATVVAENVPDKQSQGASPFENISNSVANAWSAMRGELSERGKSIEKVDLDNKYQEIRNDALNN
jgi:hypothetical protein